MFQTTEEQQTILTYVRDDFIPTIWAVRKVFAPHPVKWQSFAVELSHALAQSIEESTTPLWAILARSCPALRPQLNILSIGLHNHDADMADEIIVLAQMLVTLDIENCPDSAAMRQLIDSSMFEQSIRDLYTRLRLDPQRMPLHPIQEALQRHHFGDYIGATQTLSTVMTGLLTEFCAIAHTLLSSTGKTNPINYPNLHRTADDSKSCITESQSAQLFFGLYAVLLALQTVLNTGFSSSYEKAEIGATP